MAEQANFEPIPALSAFDGVSEEELGQQLDLNFRQVKADIDWIVTQELTRIRATPALAHLVKNLNPDDDE